MSADNEATSVAGRVSAASSAFSAARNRLSSPGTADSPPPVAQKPGSGLTQMKVRTGAPLDSWRQLLITGVRKSETLIPPLKWDLLGRLETNLKHRRSLWQCPLHLRPRRTTSHHPPDAPLARMRQWLLPLPQHLLCGVSLRLSLNQRRRLQQANGQKSCMILARRYVDNHFSQLTLNTLTHHLHQEASDLNITEGQRVLVVERTSDDWYVDSSFSTSLVRLGHVVPISRSALSISTPMAHYNCHSSTLER